MNHKDVTKVAKIVRHELKSNWPDIKFSVKSKRYTGGASINVEWTNGPTDKQVNAITRPLQYWSHMDQTDYMHTKDSEYKGECFSSGANSISLRREFTPEFVQSVADKVCLYYGWQQVHVDTSKYGNPHIPSARTVIVEHPAVWLETAIFSEARKISETQARNHGLI